MQKKVIEFLKDATSYPHDVKNLHVVETHISLVFLTGQYVYKLKKELDIGFINFSTLKKRKHACEEELRLNSRYAPDIYLELVPIYENEGAFNFEKKGEIVDYLVKMRQFEEKHLFSELIKNDEVSKEDWKKLVHDIVRFHKEAEHKEEYWTCADVKKLLFDNISVCMQFKKQLNEDQLSRLLSEKERLLNVHKTLIAERRKTHVKELHGDMHLGNICLFGGEPTLFDGIEFNARYSCCDTIADIAFLLMDLDKHGHHDLHTFVLNEYLENSDDYQGLVLLPLYLSYRAMVRAKVLALQASQRGESFSLAKEYCDLAEKYLFMKTPWVCAVGGLSGSGKSTLAKELATQTGAVILRQDAIRKHLFDVNLDEKASQEVYTDKATLRVEEGVLERVKRVSAAGYPVIIDATFRNEAYRERVQKCFSKIPFVGVWCFVDDKTTRLRLKDRIDVSDADMEIYLKQKEDVVLPKSWKQCETNESPEVLAAKLKKEFAL